MQSVNHYENFPVASWLCPPNLRPAVQAIYYFSRTADDLADEGFASLSERLADISEFRHDLNRCIQGNISSSKRWPEIFDALHICLQKFQIPTKLLHDLLDAFEQDIQNTGAMGVYRTRDELLHYCSRSANPIGRLMLHLYNVSDEISIHQSDAICTALQLINFWQDRGPDLQRGRDCLPVGHSLEAELAFARELMLSAQSLVHRIPGRAGWELRGVVQGGLCILDKLERRNTSCPAHLLERPKLGKFDYLRIIWRSFLM